MEDEIDLREYVRVLLRRWRLIVGLALVAAVAALAVSLLQPHSYEATALVAVTDLNYTLQFDPRIQATDNPNPAYAAYPQLAASDGPLQELLANLSPAPQGVDSVAGLRKILKAKAGADPSIVQLTASSRDPEKAADLANAWAEVFIARANALYGTGSEEQVAFFEAQAGQAQSKLAETEQAIVTFQGQNQANVLHAKLAAAQQELSSALAEKAQTVEAVRKAQALQAKLAGQPEDSPASPADQLTALLLQTQTLALHSTSGAPDPATGTTEAAGAAASPIGLELSDATLASSRLTAAELAASLEGLVTTLDDQSSKLDARVAALEPEILSLQQQLEQVQAEARRLTTARDLAQQTYTSLANKVDETRIAAQDHQSGVRLASQAALPASPVGQGTLTTTSLAGLAGLMIGVFAALVLEWWQTGTTRETTDPAGAGMSPYAGKVVAGPQQQSSSQAQ